MKSILTTLMKEKSTKEDFVMYRNTVLAAGGICIVLLASILQIENFTIELQIAATGIGVAIPFFIAYSMVLEYWVILGNEYFTKFNKNINLPASMMIAVAGVSLIIAIASLLLYISIFCGVFFLVSICIAFVFLVIIEKKLNHSFHTSSETLK